MKNSERLLQFFDGRPLLKKCVLEIRNRDLILDYSACRKLQECLPLVSVDSPDARNRIFSGQLIYMRMHGRDDWYRYGYSQEELEENAAMILKSGAENVYLFFNNNHSMLENAQRMTGIIQDGQAVT